MFGYNSGMDEERWAKKEFKWLGGHNITVTIEFLSSDYNEPVAEAVARTSNTGLLAPLRIEPKPGRSHLPSFSARWDQTKNTVDIDLDGDAEEKRKFKLQQPGYRGHKTDKVSDSPRVYAIDIETPATGHVFKGTITLNIDLGLTLGESLSMRADLQVESEVIRNGKPAADQQHESPPNRLKACVACKRQIQSDASVCPVCKRYQRVWKNHLQYFAGIVALVSLSATAVTVTLTTVNEMFFARSDLHLIECNSMASAVIVNSGDAEVFVSHLILWPSGKPPAWVIPRLDFGDKLAPGQFLKKEFPPARIQGTALFVRGLDDGQFQKLMARAAATDPCVEAAFFAEGDSFLQELETVAGERKLKTFEVVGYLEYRSDRGVNGRMPIRGAGVLRVDERQTCIDSVAQTVGTKNFN
jgi:hypothetical protein